MKNIYIGVITYEYEIKRLFRKPKIKFGTQYTHHLFLEGSKQEAIEKLKRSHEVFEDRYYPNCFSGESGKILVIEFSAGNGNNGSYSLETLQTRMDAKDFLEFCRQELYPIDVLIK